MRLKPLHDWAVIVSAAAADRTAGGLYIPDSAKQKPEEGVVEAIGPGAWEEKKPGKKKTGDEERKFIPTSLKPGDRVLFERWSGHTHTIGTEERILVRERDVLGIIDRPLRIPETTASGSSTAIVPTGSTPPAREEAGEKLLATPVKPAGGRKAAAKKPAAKPAKKAAKKAVANTAKKSPVKKASKAGGKKTKKKK